MLNLMMMMSQKVQPVCLSFLCAPRMTDDEHPLQAGTRLDDGMTCAIQKF
jgi:hypothetical protein